MSATRNMQSAYDHPAIVSEYLEKEVSTGPVLGPWDLQQMASTLQVNRFGVIPKKSKPNAWRLIVDLSYPDGASANDGISPVLCSLFYTSVDDVAERVQGLGRGARLAKIDIRSAYRVVPVHPENRPLLAMQCNGKWFLDTVLPFGLRSAPKIFNAIADGLEWILAQRGAALLVHYLDDFLLLGPPQSAHCSRSLSLVRLTCHQLGMAEDKFLGIEIDTVAMELRLPQHKLAALRSMIAQWRTKKVCTKRELLSIISHLQLACQPATCTLTFNASGTWGCGAFSGREWFSLQWENVWHHVHITIKELLPIVVASLIWGHQWKGQHVLALCDNAAVVSIVNSSNATRAHTVLRDGSLQFHNSG